MNVSDLATLTLSSSITLENAPASLLTATPLLPGSTVAPSLANISSGLVQLASIATTTPYTSFTSSVLTAASIQMANATGLANTTGKSHGGENEDTGECELLGPFAVIVQAALGLLALSVLVIKRWRERPQRPVKIWAFDASKQVFGSALLHLANLFMSMLSAGQIQAAIAQAAASTVGASAAQAKPNPCSFYILNLGIDTTLGIPILIVLLRLLHAGASLTPMANPPESIQSGNYGQPPRATWWLKQSVLYFLGLLLMKACVFFIFQLCPWIIVVGNWALRWTEGNEAIQIAFVMLIFPLIMNALQYYIIDSFIKNKRSTTVDEDGDGEHDESEAEDLLPPEEVEGADDGFEIDDTLKEAKVTTIPKSSSHGVDRETRVGESSSSASPLKEVDPIPVKEST